MRGDLKNQKTYEKEKDFYEQENGIYTYHQILENAEKQHKVFFKQLGIDNL